jgi:predicted polyphosphate/ATP-dependent NAD kinase
MALTRWGFIYTLGPDAPEIRRDEIGSAACVLLTTGVPAEGDAPAVARQLADEGVELIELCGAFGPAGTAAVTEAVGDRVPVGGVYDGGEATAGLAALFGPGAA